MAYDRKKAIAIQISVEIFPLWLLTLWCFGVIYDKEDIEFIFGENVQFFIFNKSY